MPQRDRQGANRGEDLRDMLGETSIVTRRGAESVTQAPRALVANCSSAWRFRKSRASRS